MKEHKFIKFIIEPSKNRMIIHKNQSFATSLPRYLTFNMTCCAKDPTLPFFPGSSTKAVQSGIRHKEKGRWQRWSLPLWKDKKTGG